MKALVGFHSKNPGRFTHCFACYTHKGFWVRIDASFGRITASIEGPEHFDIADWWRSHGMSVVEVRRKPKRFYMPIMPATCVSLVKSVLGIRAPFVLTSRQLYAHLRKE
jgi:hypothetical protein